MGRHRLFSGLLKALLSSLALLSISPASASVLPDGSTIGLQVGVPNIEADLQLPQGVYFAVGLPWTWLTRREEVAIADIPRSKTSFQSVPVAARLGWHLGISSRFRFRASFQVMSRFTKMQEGEAPTFPRFPKNTTPTLYDLSFDIMAGLRYEHPSGFVAGLDMTLINTMGVANTPRNLFGKEFTFETTLPPFSLLFSQLYLGYALRF